MNNPDIKVPKFKKKKFVPLRQRRVPLARTVRKFTSLPESERPYITAYRPPHCISIEEFNIVNHAHIARVCAYQTYRQVPLDTP